MAYDNNVKVNDMINNNSDVNSYNVVNLQMNDNAIVLSAGIPDKTSIYMEKKSFLCNTEFPQKRNKILPQFSSNILQIFFSGNAFTEAKKK